MTTTRPSSPRQTATLNLAACKLSCTLLLLCLALPVAAPAQTFTSLVAFDQTDGANPYGPSLSTLMAVTTEPPSLAEPTAKAPSTM